MNLKSLALNLSRQGVEHKAPYPSGHRRVSDHSGFDRLSPNICFKSKEGNSIIKSFLCALCVSVFSVLEAVVTEFFRFIVEME